MVVRPSTLFVAIWLGWIVSWIAAASWSARTENRLTIRRAWPYRVSILLGAGLMSRRLALALHMRRIWDVGYGGAYLLAAFTLAGILFAWWGRLHLGRLWSGSITRKEGHRVVDTGPYALVRHPIYTGLLWAILATVIAKATPTAMLGFVFIVAGVWWKARLEERFLATELGPEPYDAYRRRVPMLIPFLSARG